MWRIALVLALLVGTARADGIDLHGWTTNVNRPEVHDGALVLTHVGTFSRAFVLDPTGWAVEITFALDHRVSPATVHVDVYDSRQHVTLIRNAKGVELGTDKRPLGSDDKPHVYRIEAAAGRHRLLVDGALLVDRDVELDALGDSNPGSVSFAVWDQPAANTEPTRITSIVVDAAPANLAPSKHALPPLAQFSEWLRALSALRADLRPTFAKLQLPDDARACIAFAIVASSATPRPAHYRHADVFKWIERLTPKPKSPPKSEQPMVDPFAPNDQLSRGPYCDPAGPCDCGRPCGRATAYPERAMNLVLESFTNAPQLDAAAEMILSAAGNRALGQPSKLAHPSPVAIDWRWLLATLVDLQKHPHACE